MKKGSRSGAMVLAGCMNKLRERDKDLLEACYGRSSRGPGRGADPGPIGSEHP